LSAAAIHVVERMPITGSSQNPAAIAPAAAPAVFAAYRNPAALAALRSDRPPEPANQAAAMGKVAPIAAAGRVSRPRLSATRMAANRAGPFPSA
jgi:hypothetical protein